MESLKRLVVVAFMPLAQRGALVEGSRHSPGIGACAANRMGRGKFARVRLVWLGALRLERFSIRLL